MDMISLTALLVCRGWGWQAPGHLHSVGDPEGGEHTERSQQGPPALRGAVAVLQDMAVTAAEAVASAYLAEASSGSEGEPCYKYQTHFVSYVASMDTLRCVAPLRCCRTRLSQLQKLLPVHTSQKPAAALRVRLGLSTTRHFGLQNI